MAFTDDQKTDLVLAICQELGVEASTVRNLGTFLSFFLLSKAAQIAAVEQRLAAMIAANTAARSDVETRVATVQAQLDAKNLSLQNIIDQL